jgi:hypothetical protein
MPGEEMTMGDYEVKALQTPDESRSFTNGRVDVVRIGNHSIGRTNLLAGWRWSDAVKPIVQTDLCQVHHVGYVVSGRLGVVMGDGTEFALEPGQAYDIAAGHDAWVEGNEPFQGVEFESLSDYAKAP